VTVAPADVYLYVSTVHDTIAINLSPPYGKRRNSSALFNLHFLLYDRGSDRMLTLSFSPV
jgi:hypothetical protein